MDFINWPLSIAIIAITFIIIFRKNISNILERTKNIKSTIFSLNTNINQKNVNKELTIDNIDAFYYLFQAETTDFYKKSIKSEISLDGIPENKQTETLIKYTVIMVTIYNMDKIYYNILGSQIELLEFLNQNSNQPKEDLKRFYNNAYEKSPKLYDRLTYEQYLDFLFSYNLIANQQEGKLSITVIGKDFLKYLIQTSKSKTSIFY